MHSLSILATAVVFAAGCVSPKVEETAGPLAVMEQHYRSFGPGADWAALRRDYTDDGRIVRLSSREPGRATVTSADDWFAFFGPAIDAKDDFRVSILGSRTSLYDRMATVLMSIEVMEDDADAEPAYLYTVEQAALVLGPDERWRITQIQYQDWQEDWLPPTDKKGSVFLSVGGGTNSASSFRWMVSSNSF